MTIRENTLAHAIRFLVLAGFSVLALGCAVTGEVDPTKPVSLKGSGKALLLVGSDERIFITRLDGKSLNRMRPTTDYPEAMLVSPSRHTIRVLFTSQGYNSAAELWFVAESEKTYILRKQIDGELQGGSPIKFWVDDEATGKAVGGYSNANARPE